MIQIIGKLGLFTILLTAGMAQDVAPPKFEFKAPVVRGSIFDDNLGLLERERDEYAGAIANFVTNFVASKNADPDSLAFARKGLGLALHLSTRNKRAMVTKFQLSKGTIPRPVKAEYSPATLAALFVTRAETLFQQKGDDNRLLARALIDLAVTIDPHNEDAIYAFELQKIDYGEIKWSQFTDAPRPKEN
ncbi:MAG: hypothetical protein P1U90_16970 [Akkermansiaceae bacterium]|nr:hypothetical protein [Akkermansiaceae bacterium]